MAVVNFSRTELNVVSFNMHGFNQGLITVRDLIDTIVPDIFMLQEHWLTPANLTKFNENISQYHCFGSSAMGNAVANGPIYGRPFGGTAILIKNDLMSNCECIAVAERYVIVKLGNLLLVNVYMPCAGTIDRSLIYSDMLSEIDVYCNNYCDCSCIIGGDFNVSLSGNCAVSNLVNNFLSSGGYSRVDILFPQTCQYTYCNESLNCYSKIDYFLSRNVTIIDYNVIDSEANLSDHLPIVCKFEIQLSVNHINSHRNDDVIARLRWDRGDTRSYYNYSYQLLSPIYEEINSVIDGAFNASELQYFINSVYSKIVNCLNECANRTIPCFKKNALKFWWTQELDCLKVKSVETDRLWKEMGRPRAGEVYLQRTSAKQQYRQAIRLAQNSSTTVFTNDLHEALIRKQGKQFWNVWNSKFNCKPQSQLQVDGQVDPLYIANSFADHFSKICQPLNHEISSRLKCQYEISRSNYIGDPCTTELSFDTELVENIIVHLKRGKAAGLDALTAEHLQFCHPILPCILSKLFNLCLTRGLVPEQFCQSYTVPLLKCNSNSKITVDDYRGISISPVISKIFEHCILDRFAPYLFTNDNQFGFKKSVGCSQAIFCTRSIVSKYVDSGSTVNLCAIDISKAFDKMNHHGLLLKLMNRKLPLSLLSLIEFWFVNSVTTVKWMGVYSRTFNLQCGIRQGGVLSPYLFAIYIDSVIDRVQNSYIGCRFGSLFCNIIMFADDILLLSPSVSALQELLQLCECELTELDLAINARKSTCIRIGRRYSVKCSNLLTTTGQSIKWVNELRYLGVFLVSGNTFKCSLDHAKQSFFRAFNAIFGKIGRLASDDVILKLLYSKCLPCLLYATEAMPFNSHLYSSLEFSFNRVLFKIFQTGSTDIINDIKLFFGISSIKTLITDRKINFSSKMFNVSNLLCNSCNEWCKC